jgi:type IV pilus assembly protein PilM
MALFSRETVTLDFEGSTLRWLTVSRGQVRRWNRVHLKLPPTTQSRPDPGLIGEQVAAVFEAESLPRGRVVMAISGQRTIFRILTLPKMDDSLLDAAVQRKLRQEVPLQAQETDVSWQIVSREPNEISIYVVAIPREEIDHHVAILRAADLEATSMDVKPLALVRSVNRPLGIVVSLEDQALTIVVVVDNVPQIIRTVPLGTSSASIEGRLDLLAQELLRTTKFYNESHKSRPLPADCPLFLAGSSFQSRPMVERMAPRSPYPLTDLAPPIAYPDGLSVPEFSVNLGLALKDL